MAAIPGRTTAQYRTNRENLRAQRLPCWLCRQDIDYDAPKADPLSFTADHVRSLKTHPELADEPTNLRPAHFKCNSSRQDRAPVLLGSSSRTW